ncbi:EXS family-domain-containing protein [Mycotypha africana]|uniref:EXS family-domain-containing protein n=1 Tax=Mycotypha africana TaxID=64632 RepID=UPI002300E599|nr:EXS family-domain-containing protein [Mycotypha africana]KAI8967611.1 EXS family-domain-containing protein [Mycotypha africana]
MLGRAFTPNLLAPVFFSDVILADMLTSFSNVFGDLFIAFCVLFTGKDAAFFIDNVDNIYSRDYIVPLLISFPYLIRLKQCIAEYIVTKEKRHIFNSLKYASSIPVVISSALHRKAMIYVSEAGTVPTHWFMSHDTIFHFWILFVFINSMYSFWWDISMDWNLINVSKSQPPVMEDIPQSSTPSIHFRRQLYFSQPIWYILAIIIDFLLRVTWSFKLSSHIYIQKLNGSMFLMELFEVSRRWMWVIFRIESEWVRKVYTTLPSSNNNSNSLRMNLMRRKSAGLLSPIDEEDSS